MSHLKRNPNYCTWTRSRTKRWNPWQYWILAAVSRCWSWCTAWNRYDVISAVLSLDEHLSQTNTSCIPKFSYQSVYCCIIRYCLVRIRIAKCFTNSSKRYRSKGMFENEHTFCSWIHHVRIWTAFAQLEWAEAYQPVWPWLECHGGRPRECITRGRTCFWFHFSFLLGCVLSGIPCTCVMNFCGNRNWSETETLVPFMCLVSTNKQTEFHHYFI
jgi:hypothetical protein